MLWKWRHIYSHISKTYWTSDIIFSLAYHLKSHYSTDKALNILFKFSHNLKWYIIRISFERVLRNIQKNLLLKGYAPTSFPGKISENEVGYAYLLQVSLQFWKNYKIAPEEKWVWGEVRTPWLSLWMLPAKLRSRSQVVSRSILIFGFEILQQESLHGSRL